VARPELFGTPAARLPAQVAQAVGFVLGLLLEVRLEHIDHCEGRNLGTWNAPGQSDSWVHIGVRAALWYPINGSWHIV
jgi:hypothetical protein